MAAKLEKPANAAQLLAEFLRRNRARFPTHAAFAAEIGCSPGRLSQILGGDLVSPTLAVRIHRATRAAVPGNASRPDLWRRAADVPLETA